MVGSCSKLPDFQCDPPGLQHIYGRQLRLLLAFRLNARFQRIDRLETDLRHLDTLVEERETMTWVECAYSIPR